MKTKFLKAVALKSKQRRGVALLFFLCLISFAITPGAAQVRNPKRITALQLSDATEGARVTIVSDSALNDYEAFRRGDRFYVKIPVADFNSAFPRLRADGFDAVQVQKFGDGVIVSFKLQPGATARVDQRLNKLEVTFSAPNRILPNKTAGAESTRVTSDSSVPRMREARGPNAAGRMPPGSNKGASNQLTSTNDQSTGGNNQATAGNAASSLPSSVPFPSSILTPSNSSSYPALTAATPAAPAGSQSAVSSSTGSPSLLDWKARGKAALQWASVNRLATLLGVVILLSLILYLATAVYRRRKNRVRERPSNVLSVQPRVQPSSSVSFEDSTNPITSPALSKLPKEFVDESAIAAAASQSQPRMTTKPSIVSQSVVHDACSSEGG
jgi:hypothetical protein